MVNEKGIVYTFPLIMEYKSYLGSERPVVLAVKAIVSILGAYSADTHRFRLDSKEGSFMIQNNYAKIHKPC